MIDLLFLARNRLEFTKASFSMLVANTNWSLVSTLWVYDDGSSDGTRQWLTQRWGTLPMHCKIIDSCLGAPAAIMNDYLARSTAGLFAKVNNDVIVPPGWLNRCAGVMREHASLDLLGIEPPQSRTPHHAGGARSACPELMTFAAEMYAPCDSIGGVGLMRRRAFLDNGVLVPHSIYGGFTEWQLQHATVKKGWIVPPLRVFLLDRLPTEPWASLSRGYIARGWQRAWSSYDPAVPFWDWWEAPEFCDHSVRSDAYCAPCGRILSD